MCHWLCFPSLFLLSITASHSWTHLFQIQVILPTAYQPTGTATLYPIEVKGIELEGIEDIIAVRVNSVKTGGYTDSYVAYPDEVLGEVGTNLYRLPTMYVAGGIHFYIYLQAFSPVYTNGFFKISHVVVLTYMFLYRRDVLINF